MVFLFWSKGMKYLKHALLEQVPYREKHVVYRVMIEFPAEIKFVTIYQDYPLRTV